MEYFCANILKSGHWPRTRCRLKIFYFSALAAILFNGAQSLRPSWIFDRYNFSLFQSRSHPVATESFSSKRSMVWEERLKTDFQDGGCGGHLGFFYQLIYSTAHVVSAGTQRIQRPGWNHRGILKFNPSHANPPPPPHPTPRAGGEWIRVGRIKF